MLYVLISLSLLLAIAFCYWKLERQVDQIEEDISDPHHFADQYVLDAPVLQNDSHLSQVEALDNFAYSCVTDVEWSSVFCYHETMKISVL